MKDTYSLVGPNLYMNQIGRMFEKTAQEYTALHNKFTEAEDRFVERNLKGVQRDEKTSK